MINIKTQMKKITLALGAAVILMASFTNINKQKENTFIATNLAQTSPGEKLINQSDCVGCHNKNEQLVGPSYVDIAKKYPATPKNIDMLANKIIKGGKGNWGETPMMAHPNIKPADAKTMVKYILSLKKK